MLARWDSPAQRDAYAWFTVELANLRAAFRWAADHDDLDTAAAIAFYAALLGFWLEQYEPVAWAEELIEPARAVEHHRLAQLYAMAAQCYATGRLDDSFGYAEAGQVADRQRALRSGFRHLRKLDRWCVLMVGALQTVGRLVPQHDRTKAGTHSFARACLVFALTLAGASDEAMAASETFVAAADALTIRP